MIPIINHKETGINIRRLMDAKNLTVKMIKDSKVYQKMTGKKSRIISKNILGSITR